MKSHKAVLVVIGLIVLATIFSSGSLAFASVTSNDAKQMAMGGPHVALYKDPGSAMVNPAAMVWLKSIASDAAIAVSGDNNINGTGFPLNVGGLDESSLPNRFNGEISVNGGVYTPFIGISVNMDAAVNMDSSTNRGSIVSNRRYALNSATRLQNPPLSLGALAVGADLNWDVKTESRYAFNGSDWNRIDNTETVGYSIDVGAVGQLTDLLSFGLVMEDLIYYRPWTNVSPVTFNPKLSIGVALNPPVTGFTIAADIMDYDISGGVYDALSIGIEQKIFNLVDFECGLIKPSVGNNIYSVGVGVDYNVGSVNLAANTDGTNIGLSLSTSIGF